jgi:hypothetical protein
MRERIVRSAGGVADCRSDVDADDFRLSARSLMSKAGSPDPTFP